MYKNNKVFSIILLICILLSLVSCDSNDKDVQNIEITTVESNLTISPQTTKKQKTNNSSTNVTNTTNTTKKNIVDDDYSYKNILDLEVKLPKYIEEKEIKSSKYSSNVYTIEPNEIVMGISLYSSNDKYPDDRIYSDYIEKDSVNSINQFTVSDTIKNYFKINQDSFFVNESTYKKNSDVKTKHNVYKLTGYIYTDHFTTNKKQKAEASDEGVIYYYSNAIKIDQQVIVLWVCDLTEEHLYQEECSKILNDIMMEKI